MTAQETPLEMARRHVVEGEARVASQSALVTGLVQKGHDTTAAELLLSTMSESLLLMRAHLADEQGASNGDQQ
jgi:hypothetical protein